MRHAILVSGIVLALGIFTVPAAFASAGAPTISADSPLIRHVESAARARARGNHRESLKLWDAAIADKDFARLAEKDQAMIFLQARLSAFELKQYDVAYRYTVEATHREGVDADDWRNRLAYEILEKHFADAVQTVEEMASRNRGALNTIPPPWFDVLDREVKADAPLQRRLIKALATAYRPDDPAQSADRFKRRYAAILTDAGEKAEAWELARAIVSSGVLIDLSLDSRLRDALPAGFDGRAEVERNLNTARRDAADHPESLSTLLVVTRYLRQLGRMEEAQELLEAVGTDKQGSVKFKDWETNRVWLSDTLARIYLRLGRYDDAVAAFRRAMKFKEGDGRNVSQTINLGYAQLRFGRPGDALATVSLLKPESAKLSAYGWMEMRGLQGCARLALGQAAAAKDDLDYVAAHEQDNPDVLTMLQLCAGDLDGAAAAIIRRLDDPELRPAALRYLSDYDPPPASYPVSPVDTRRGELKARPDVQAAIARAGGIRRFRLQETEI